jgi:hypothetical protein
MLGIPSVEGGGRTVLDRWNHEEGAVGLHEPSGIISASSNFSEDRMSGGGTLDYSIGVATNGPSKLEPASLEVQAGTWAVFERDQKSCGTRDRTQRNQTSGVRFGYRSRGGSSWPERGKVIVHLEIPVYKFMLCLKGGSEDVPRRPKLIQVQMCNLPAEFRKRSRDN